ncbi:MAG: cation-translocating P-type ATPase [Thermoanaerobaculia bacterium]
MSPPEEARDALSLGGTAASRPGEVLPPGHPGLTEQEAARRLAAEGPNEIAVSRPRSLLRLTVTVLREPMVLLLVAGGAIYLLLGDPLDGLVLIASILGVTGISLYQNRRTERALEALRDLSSPRALVVRGSRRRRIPGREVVRGDTLLLAEGDRVPADGALLDAANLAVDASLLTGESAPVAKTASAASAAAMTRAGEDRVAFVYSGTLVTAGRGVAGVLATGPATEMGRIGHALRTVAPPRTPLQSETERIVRVVAAIGLLLCLVVAAVYGGTRGSWLNGLLAGVTLAMALVPEEFPVVLTVFLALGAWRLSRRQVLARRAAAIEALGSATVLCVDKTGTLTQNRMAVVRLAAGERALEVAPEGRLELTLELRELVEAALLASPHAPFDPMEIAIADLGHRALAGSDRISAGWRLRREYPLSPALLAVTHLWEGPEGGERFAAAKGAPEAIADLCRLEAASRERFGQEVEGLARQGLRVLAVAAARGPAPEIPATPRGFAFELAGLLGFSDPVRPGVPAALRDCDGAGIRVAMVTGDYPSTAVSVARQIGIPAEDVLTGRELDGISDVELRSRVRRTRVFARVVPEQKLRLVRAFQANGEVVAMTGDGVNDAPALRAAHIGVAMGSRGTDVAREAADLVLLDDDFSSIVAAVGIGRTIFDNLQKAMTYILAIHVPIAGLSLVPVLLGWPLALLPVHVLFLELIIDPACSIAFEAEPPEGDVFRRPPRRARAPLLSGGMLRLALLQGAGILAIVLAVYAAALLRGQGEDDARALSFATLVVANLSLILTNRSASRSLRETIRSPNAALWWITGGAMGLLALVLSVPALRRLFHFSTLHGAEVAIFLSGGILSVVWFEFFKHWRRKRPTAR